MCTDDLKCPPEKQHKQKGLQPGSITGKEGRKYKLLGPLGRSHASSVWLASCEHQSSANRTDPEVAIKVDARLTEEVYPHSGPGSLSDKDPYSSPRWLHMWLIQNDGDNGAKLTTT